jgi:hypothetical protein
MERFGGERRIYGVRVYGMRARSGHWRWSVVGIGFLTLATACSSSGSPAAQSTSAGPTSTSTSTAPAVTVPPTPTLPGASDRVVVRGEATLDGAPLDSRWVGAVVVRDGLVTPCQNALPPITKGRYEVTVLAATESSGCGAPGAQIVLWAYADDTIVFSADAVAWPGNGQSANFGARYSKSAPAGAAPTTAQFTGRALGSDGHALPVGARVDAFVGSTRCGTASVRSSPDFFGYVLAVVGPDAIAECTRGATLSFTIDGRPATGAPAVNTPPGRQEPLDLRLS